MTDLLAPRRDILVVDDDKHALAGLVEVLRDAGYHVTGAATFKEGRRVLASQKPDLLITDIRLGEYNGLQLVIRARHGGSPIPAIVVTGFSDAVVRDETERLDGIYLEKPIDPSEFVRIVTDILTVRDDRRF